MMCGSLFIITSKGGPTSNSSQKCISEDVCKVSTNKNATSWVQATIAMNRANFNLFRTQEKSQASKGEKCHYVVIKDAHKEMNIENTLAQNKPNRVTQTNILTTKWVPASKQQLSVAKNKDVDNKDQSNESGLIEAASLAEKLLLAYREWFLKYLKDSLDDGNLNEEARIHLLYDPSFVVFPAI